MASLEAPITDITIVGSGIVGGTLACALIELVRDCGLSIALVEKTKPSPVDKDIFDPRVVALNEKSIGFLRDINIWAGVESLRYCPYQKMHVWDGEGTGSIHFDAREVHAPYLGAIVENSVLNHSLQTMIDANSSQTEFDRSKGLHWIRDTVLNVSTVGIGNEPAITQLRLQSGDTLYSRLVLAADGAHSHLRQQAAFKVHRWDYKQTAIITTVKHECSHEDTAWQRFAHTGPLAFLPLKEHYNDEKKYSSIVWSLNNEQADATLALDDADFCQALSTVFEQRLGRVEWADKRHAVKLEQLHAREYIKPGLALLGDAAHRLHPLAGQGVNLGLSDAFVLSNEIKRALKRNIPLREFSILKRYQRQRRMENLAAMATMEAFKQVFSQDSPTITTLRNIGLQSVNRLTPIKHKLISLAQGID